METKNKKHRNKGMIKGQKGLNYATFIRVNNVNNCTIPPANKEDLVEVEMYGHKFFACKYVDASGNGKHGTANKWYKEMRPAKKQRTSKTDSYFTTKKPWYIYSTKKRKETKVETIDSLLEARANAKMLSWDRKNPAPKMPKIEDSDIFKNDENIAKNYKEACEKHKDARSKVFEKAKLYAKSLFDKGILYGRFLIADGKYTEKNGNGYPVELGIIKGSNKNLKAQDKTNELRKKHTNLVATKLKTETDEKIFMPKNNGHIVLPELKQAA